jgi:SAM-dependent methyltransferase
MLAGRIAKFETASERVAVVDLGPLAISAINRLGGVHKVGPLLDEVDEAEPDPKSIIGRIAEHFDELPVLSVSGYDLEGDVYEVIVRALLDGLRDRGYRKTRLLRPKGNELRADEVVSRRALDVIAFPYHRGCGLGPTSWVPDIKPLRERGVNKPAPNSEISLSPRLATILLNLAGLSPGGVVLDPFCGSGTILAEALVRKHRCLGFDSSERRVRDARRNLSWTASAISGASFNVQVGDARNLPEILGRTRVNAVVTEPLLLPELNGRPRTETATVLVDRASEVYADALASMAEVLLPGGRIVVVVPIVLTMEGETVSISLEGRSLGLKLHQPGPISFQYPVKLSFESTRWVKRAVYVFDS